MNAVESVEYDAEVTTATYLRRNLLKTIAENKLYKRCVEYRIVSVEESSYSAIKSKVIVHAPVSVVMQTYINRFSDISAERSPKELIAVQTLQKLVFQTDQDRAKYFNMQPVEYKIHMFNESPALLITPHREFFVNAKLCQTANGYKICQTQGKRFEPLRDRSIEGSYKCGCIEFSSISEAVTEINQFVHVEPNGSVPAELYNAVLDRGNEILLLLKRESERGFDASNGNSFDSQ